MLKRKLLASSAAASGAQAAGGATAPGFPDVQFVNPLDAADKSSQLLSFMLKQQQQKEYEKWLKANML